ncbi:MAG: hypothetical protein ABIO70_02585 [Pseudomonadota bacterium]
MGVGGFDGMAQLAKQARKAMEENAQRREEHRARARARLERTQKRGDVTANMPTEDLCCPRCRRIYPFGDECPHCGEVLVGAADVEAVAEPVEESSRSRYRRYVGVALALAIPVLMAAAVFWAYR